LETRRASDDKPMWQHEDRTATQPVWRASRVSDKWSGGWDAPHRSVRVKDRVVEPFARRHERLSNPLRGQSTAVRHAR
jgi:hypothetical protein